MGPDITAFFDDATNTISYIVRDPNGSSCAIIDSVLDFDFASGRTDTRSADKLVSFVRDNNLDVQWLLESHVHADHLSAAPYIQMKVGGKIGIGSRITDVQELHDIGVNVSQMKLLGYTPSELYTNTIYTLTEIRDGVYTATDFKNDANMTIQNSHDAGFTVAQMKLAGHTVGELKNSYTIDEIYDASFSFAEMRPHYTLNQLKVVGFSAQTMSDNGISNTALTEITPQYSSTVLRAVGVTAIELTEGGNYGYLDLVNAGYSEQEIVDAGFDISGKIEIGYTVQDF